MGGHVTLDNGEKYDFTNMANHETVLHNFMVGDAVSINYAHEGTAAAAQSISPLNASDTVVGVLGGINRETGRVTAPGTEFDLSALPDYQAKLNNFKTGDRVSVAYGLDGTGLIGNAISSAANKNNAITGTLTVKVKVTEKGDLQVKFEDSNKPAPNHSSSRNRSPLGDTPTGAGGATDRCAELSGGAAHVSVAVNMALAKALGV